MARIQLFGRLSIAEIPTAFRATGQARRRCASELYTDQMFRVVGQRDIATDLEQKIPYNLGFVQCRGLSGRGRILPERLQGTFLE